MLRQFRESTTAKTLCLVLACVFCAPATGQIDVGEGAILDSVKCFMPPTPDSRSKTTKMLFKFRRPMGKFYLTTKKNVVIMDFYDAVLKITPPQDSLRPPFVDLKISKRRENTEVIKGMAPRMTDVVRAELTIKKGVDFVPALTGSNRIATLTVDWHPVSLKSAERTKRRMNYVKYGVTALLVVAVITVFALMFDSDESDSGDDLYKTSP